MKSGIFVSLSVFVLAALGLFLFQDGPRADEWDASRVKEWDAAFMTSVKRGEELWHGPALAGNSVQCAMCHPNATNTHPETYPKFQKQLGKVATLAEMINWCIQNPLEGKPLAFDSADMTALQAYIAFERKGVLLAPGKH